MRRRLASIVLAVSTAGLLAGCGDDEEEKAGTEMLLSTQFSQIQMTAGDLCDDQTEGSDTDPTAFRDAVREYGNTYARAASRDEEVDAPLDEDVTSYLIVQDPNWCNVADELDELKANS